nr:hypothetical protein [Tanacetum cinerariifolium]
MQEELLQFKRLDVWVLVPHLDNIKPLTLIWLFKNKHDEENTVIQNKTRLAKPTEKHLKEVKRIFRFRGTVNMGLWYTKDSGFELTGFSDAEYAECKDTFKSTSSKSCLAGPQRNKTVRRYQLQKQNMSIAISCNPVQHSRTKHIVVRYHFIKEHVENGMIELNFIKTDYQLVDLFIKALPVDRFNYLVCRLGMRSLSPRELDRLVKLQ